ncbi:MAG: nuclear transport factor 2 family protein [Gammaproteobacteria bacterium]|nr:nuclear transport factor 2 family protein [Gammaproteobacteria bacterium]
MQVHGSNTAARALARAGAALVLVAIASGCVPKPDPQAGALAAEVATLRGDVADAHAQNAIRGLMHAYGRLIDARDWDSFAKLWTDDAVYVGGPGTDTLKGGPAIAAFLRKIIGANPAGVSGPNFHVFFNEEIHVSGDTARATSMSTFLTPGPTGAPMMVILARYEDEYVARNGEWKFHGRVVHSNLPVTRPKAK